MDTITVTDALDIASNEALLRGLGDTGTVQDAIDTKRTSPHFQDLVDSIRRDGITTPILIRVRDGNRYLVEGHHRITAAAELGLTAVPYTTDGALVTRIERMQWKLTFGVINDAAVEAFTRGGCAALAIAIHDTTGWPIVEVGHCDGLGMHSMVRTPDGRLLDINGPQNQDDVADDYEFYADNSVVTFTDMPRDAVWACYRDECGEPVPMEVAATFVTPVLALTSATVPA